MATLDFQYVTFQGEVIVGQRTFKVDNDWTKKIAINLGDWPFNRRLLHQPGSNPERKRRSQDGERPRLQMRLPKTTVNTKSDPLSELSISRSSLGVLRSASHRRPANAYRRIRDPHRR